FSCQLGYNVLEVLPYSFYSAYRLFNSFTDFCYIKVCFII
ncbi:unnamed protein product, partial [marine sediment metagenome]